MKILKLLNKNYLSIILVLSLINFSLYAEEEPVDIWNIDKEKIETTSKNNNSNSQNNSEKQVSETDIYNMQSSKKINSVEVDGLINNENIKIFGLYDPEDYGFKIDMWSNSNGDQLKYLFSNLSELSLSEDAAEIMNISLLTNAYLPKKNISEKEFLQIKSNWLIKSKNLSLIEEYLIKNQILNYHPKLSRYLVDKYLSESNVIKACEIFSKNTKPINDIYLSKFNLYCLINDGKKEEAQLILDLKKEDGFSDKYFENKINFLFGYTEKIDSSISENSILDFHLAHRTNPEFSFEPKNNTNDLIWRYLSTSNLLYNIEEIEITEFDKIKLIEKAVNDKNYSEDDLFEIYKRFQFNINQLLNTLEAHKMLTNIEAKALIYQRILLESDVGKKVELIKVLKDLFIKDNLPDAFDDTLTQLLSNLDPEEIPSNFTTFYFDHIENEKKIKRNIKYNNDILHQSKLVNYFENKYEKSKIEKDLNNFLKKIKKNKKYILSKKDIIFIESLRSDGIEISKKYNDLYKLDETEMPIDIQVMINNNEIGAVILRIIEVIGQDNIDSLDDDTLFFIISALNQLNIDFIRNKILLKVLPLKV